MHYLSPRSWNLDVDRWLNYYIPRNRVDRLPSPISRFLGHGQRKPIGNVLVAWWAFIGAFIGIVIVEAVLMIPEIHNHGVPIVVASFGAAAVLEYNFIESPLAQPRNSVLGHLLAALVGVCITKLFKLNSNFEELRWLAGALACGLASAAMVFAKAVYPPAGATALLAAIDPNISALGWYFLPIVFLSALLILVSSLLINNIQRRYPLYWWTPANVGEADANDIEKMPSNDDSSHQVDSTHEGPRRGPCITITADHITIPEHLQLAREQELILEVLRNQLKDDESHEDGPLRSL